MPIEHNKAEVVFKARLTKTELVELIKTVKPGEGRPAFVAISGYGGSGKSTLAQSISEDLGSSIVIPIDDFITGSRTQRSVDWQTFDRDPLRKEVLEKARPEEVLRYKRFNSGEWVNGLGGSLRELQVGQFVIIKGCGIIHPKLMDYYDCSVWIDCPQQLALETAKRRDQTNVELFGDDDTTRLWDEVWGPNDRDYFKTFRPDNLATALVERPF